MTADDKYSLWNKDNLQQPIELQLFKKQTLLSQLSAASVKFAFNFQLLAINDERPSACFSESVDREGRRYLNV